MPRRKGPQGGGASPWGPAPPRPLHEIPLARLTGHPDAPPGMLEDWERRTAGGWETLEAQAAARGLRGAAAPCAVEGYRIAQDVDGAGRGLVVAFDAGGAVAGGVLQGNVHVYPAHRGRGLGAELVARAFACGLKREGDYVVLSPGGRATRRAAHRRAVEAALAGGVEVPEEVLADYPGLAGGPGLAA